MLGRGHSEENFSTVAYYIELLMFVLENLLRWLLIYL